MALGGRLGKGGVGTSESADVRRLRATQSRAARRPRNTAVDTLAVVPQFERLSTAVEVLRTRCVQGVFEAQVPVIQK